MSFGAEGDVWVVVCLGVGHGAGFGWDRHGEWSLEFPQCMRRQSVIVWLGL